MIRNYYATLIVRLNIFIRLAEDPLKGSATCFRLRGSNPTLVNVCRNSPMASFTSPFFKYPRKNTSYNPPSSLYILFKEMIKDLQSTSLKVRCLNP